MVCGDGEYIIYTAMALRNKAFGSGQEFAWAADSSQYAVRENSSTVKVFKNFKERKSIKPDFGAEAIHGGHLLGVKSPSGLAFYDWDSLELIRRIEIQPKMVLWSENGELVAIATEESYFILSYDQNAFASAESKGEEVTEDGVESAFDVSGSLKLGDYTRLDETIMVLIMADAERKGAAVGLMTKGDGSIKRIFRL